MRLYSYFRSSAAYRVRIALALKGLPYDYLAVHLLKDGGQQLKPDFRRLSPAALVPVLEDGGHVLTQSLAIIEYLEETHPQPALLPATPAERARVRALALDIACDIHPLNNLRVLKYLKSPLGIDQQGRDEWYRHWVEGGLAALERMLADSPATGLCCHGDQPTLADLCLVPQVYNARRLKSDLTAMPTVVRIADHCAALPAFQAAHPDAQPDAE
ncbi:maleylacetoacetate isomerase [Pigmentiphaga sp. GD03639]|jgi:maleylpyruvate isomerase|uniref:Maleylacetoacetate isomerase n=1 Tax=Pigmentiphaga daeguensis TaxID=414049 RepID=A0ABN1BAY0_9BURK|nr:MULTISPECIES: maleylacetoacetate isomerase [unclassified Pigmentiphaga]MDH2237689.1 maleylacetoacetate isomerase [Pigmentiphaga sp. GD03639]OVZ62220.1 maleylacetoacetate isomerase [Pigmentiphaga sp. NML030171]